MLNIILTHSPNMLMLNDAQQEKDESPHILDEDGYSKELKDDKENFTPCHARIIMQLGLKSPMINKCRIKDAVCKIKCM